MMMKFAMGLFLAMGTLAFAQSRQETITFLTREIRSYETDTFIVKELAFPEEPAAFKLRTYQKQAHEIVFEIPLASVEFFTRHIRAHGSPNQYELMVKARGRNGRFKVNGFNLPGEKLLLPADTNGRKVRALAKALNHLVGLSTGR